MRGMSMGNFLSKSSNLSDLGSAPTARTNLGLSTVSGSGSYNDLSDKPTIPSAATTSNPLSVYGVGTVYSLTNTSALLDFGTTDPSLTINAAGTYLIIARAKLDFNAATFIAARTTTIKLRRTNNTAADLSSGSVTAKAAISISAQTFTFIDQTWSVTYTTSNSNDIIQIFGSIDTVPGAGSVDASEASIIAIRLQS